VARVLIVGGGCRGRGLAETLVGAGHAVRITTRSESGRAAIEAAGAECWVGDPDRIATLRQSLDRVTVACWLLGTASGDEEQLQALFGTRLEYWLTQVIDTTVRGFVYESGGTVAPELLASGWELVQRICTLNSIPHAFVGRPAGHPRWEKEASAVAQSFLGPGV
jgi:hypothetical protein